MSAPKLPREVTLTGPSYTVFPQAIAMARNGYRFADRQTDQAFPNVAGSVLNMVLGVPTAEEVEAADAAIALALVIEQRQEALLSAAK
jgi:hypothetical protein